MKLIRSKGVGIYFVTQNPLDIPESVLAQMGNRVQHALRAYTPREQKAVQTAASTFRPNPAFKTDEVITQLGKGEALVSVLDLKGVPTMVERTMVRPPSSRMGPITPEERQKIVKNVARLWTVRGGRRPRVGLRDPAEGRRRTRRGGSEGQGRDRSPEGREGRGPILARAGFRDRPFRQEHGGRAWHHPCALGGQCAGARYPRRTDAEVASLQGASLSSPDRAQG